MAQLHAKLYSIVFTIYPQIPVLGKGEGGSFVAVLKQQVSCLLVKRRQQLGEDFYPRSPQPPRRREPQLTREHIQGALQDRNDVGINREPCVSSYLYESP